MTAPITIPLAAAEALGAKVDGAAVSCSGSHIAGTVQGYYLGDRMRPGWGAVVAYSNRQWCTFRCEPDDASIIVAENEGRLLAALARHLGWQGGHLLQMRVEHWGTDESGHRVLLWVIRGVTKWGQMPFRDGQTFCAQLPAHISTDIDYTEALAEAVCWYARSARCEEATGFPADDQLLERWNDDSSSMWSLLIEVMPLPDVLATIEQHLGLPPLDVRR